jgi:hypothetical protein
MSLLMGLNQADLFELLEAFAIELRGVANASEPAEACQLISIAVVCDVIAPRDERQPPTITREELRQLAYAWESMRTSRYFPGVAVPAAWIKPPTDYLNFVACQIPSMTRARAASPSQLVETFGHIGAEIAHLRRRGSAELRGRLHDLETLCQAIAPNIPSRRPKVFKRIQQAHQAERPAMGRHGASRAGKRAR